MLPEDMMAALGGGGAPPAPGGAGGLPPDIMAALGGGGAPPAEAAPPAGALHGGSAAEGDPEAMYRSALDALEMGMKADVDEARIAAMMKVATVIQGELANSQKASDGMASGKFDAAGMRRMGAAEQAY